MRTLLLASALLLVAACSDNQQPTAPRSASSRDSAAGDVAPAGQGIAQPYSKPADQVGFTKVTTVFTQQIHIDGVNIKAQEGVATCPAGSTLTGGGYNILWGELDARVGRSTPDGANGWQIFVYDASATPIDFQVFALCAS